MVTAFIPASQMRSQRFKEELVSLPKVTRYIYGRGEVYQHQISLSPYIYPLTAFNLLLQGHGIVLIKLIGGLTRKCQNVAGALP